jgi:hypothetical protein
MQHNELQFFYVVGFSSNAPNSINITKIVFIERGVFDGFFQQNVICRIKSAFSVQAEFTFSFNCQTSVRV